MKSVKLAGNSKVEIVDAPEPVPAKDEALIRVTASGICGSELHSYRAPDGLPLNSGHEVTGVIADANGHDSWKPGERVGVFTLQGCGRCRWCAEGKDDFCADMMVPPACHSEYTTARARSLVRLEDLETEIDDRLAVLIFGDGMGVPYGATARAGVRQDETTCVFGCGPVGLGMVLIQSFLGARVIAVDVNPKRLEFARRFGAVETVDPSQGEDLVQRLRGLTDGVGPDKCFEAAGRQETLDAAVACARPEGVVCLVGHGAQTFDPQQLIAKRNLTLMGNWIYHPGEWRNLTDMQARGLRAERLVTSILPFSEAATGYKAAAQGAEAKVLLNWA